LLRVNDANGIGIKNQEKRQRRGAENAEIAQRGRFEFTRQDHQLRFLKT
jgi:hypothetical protein